MKNKIIFLVIITLFLFSVTAAAQQTILVGGVNLNNYSLTLKRSASETLTAYVQPNNATNKNVTWTSSNNNVAAVTRLDARSARVDALSAGVAYITVKTEDGGFEAVCRVEVYVPVSAVYMQISELELEVSEDYQFQAFVEPDDATNQEIAWRSSDNSIIMVDDAGLAVARAPGTARVVALSAEDENINDYCTVTVVSTSDLPDEEEDEQEGEQEAEGEIIPAEPQSDDIPSSGSAFNPLYIIFAVLVLAIIILSIILVIRNRKA